ncbi:MAG: hypothetical protein SPI86_04600, partial [Treponemataceae bacterium]|nr:hypothetical protein [Treponemataceae bacterium]
MPGLNQLKKFIQDISNVGNETSSRVRRGERYIPLTLPPNVKDFDDRDDFLLGLPDAKDPISEKSVASSEDKLGIPSTDFQNVDLDSLDLSSFSADTSTHSDDIPSLDEIPDVAAPNSDNSDDSLFMTGLDDLGLDLGGLNDFGSLDDLGSTSDAGIDLGGLDDLDSTGDSGSDLGTLDDFGIDLGADTSSSDNSAADFAGLDDLGIDLGADTGSSDNSATDFAGLDDLGAFDNLDSTGDSGSDLGSLDDFGGDTGSSDNSGTDFADLDDLGSSG